MSQILKQILRPALIFLAMIAVVALFRAGPASVAAENRISLDAGVKARLQILTPLRRTGISADAFNGRPVLVTFFASW
jgi:hypothetical protein